MARVALCSAVTRVYDPAKGIPPQWVSCIRNAGHPAGVGAHWGAAKKNDETIEMVLWDKEEPITHE